MTDTENDELNVEEVSKTIHEIYMKEARRQGDVRHKDNYEELTEDVKEFDRVIARYILAKIEEAEKRCRDEIKNDVQGRIQRARSKIDNKWYFSESQEWLKAKIAAYQDILDAYFQESNLTDK